MYNLIHGDSNSSTNPKMDDKGLIKKMISNFLIFFRTILVPFCLVILVIITLMGTESFAQAATSEAGNFIKNSAYVLVSIIGAGLMMVLWLITRFLGFLFRTAGGFMYGSFINNPLDTELVYIRPLWSFLVDFGNLLVLASFLALAMVYLFDLKLPVNRDLSKFATGIVIIAIMMNFSLTLTSAVATTIHNIGIGMVFLTIDNTSSAKIDLSSQRAYRESLMKSGNAFFDAINNNFVETLSCTGNAVTTYPDNSKKTMAEICLYHKKDKGVINPLGLFGAVEASIPAITFFIIGSIREMVVLILLATGLSVIITLLKLSLYRLAYLWLVGVFSGPALIAAVSPFEGMHKYFKIWLNWLITFSTMMIVFVMGFYLSSYIATIVIPTNNPPPEALPDIMNDTTGFVTGLSNIILASVIPLITFPLISIVILQLLAKYLNDAYKTQAESMLNMAGKMVNEAKNSTVGVVKNIKGAGDYVGGNIKGGIDNIKGGYGNVMSAGDNLQARNSNAQGDRFAQAARESRALGLTERAEKYDAKAAAAYGNAAVSSARAKKVKDDIVNNKDYKERVAGLKYQGAANNADALSKLGVSGDSLAADAKKAGVSNDTIQKGKIAAKDINKRTGIGDAVKEKENEILQQSNKNFNNDFEKIRQGLYDETDAKLNENAEAIKNKRNKYVANEQKYKQNIEIQSATGLGATATLREKDKAKDRNKELNLNQKELEKERNELVGANKSLAPKRKVYEDLATEAGRAANADQTKAVEETVNKQFAASNPGAARAAAFKASKVKNEGNNASEIRSASDQARTKVSVDVSSGKSAGKQLYDLSQDETIGANEKKQKEAGIRRSLNSQARKYAEVEFKKLSKPDDE